MPGGAQEIRETIASLKQFSKRQTFGGLKIKDLISEGRREAAFSLTPPSPLRGALTTRLGVPTRALLDRFAEEQAAVPSLWHLQLTSALAVSERNQRITRANSSEFIALIGRLPIVVDEETPSLALRTGARPGSE